MTNNPNMELFPKQSMALDTLRDNKTKYVLYGGAAGGGKSWLGAYWIWWLAFKYPGIRLLVGRSELKALKQSTLVTMFKVAGYLKIQGGKGNHFFYNSQNNEIRCENESVILLKDLKLYPSDPNFDSLGSVEITAAFIDEANQITVKAKNIVASRMRHNLKKFGLIPKLLCTCNPAKNWVYNEFYKPAMENVLPDTHKFFPAYPQDNPELPKEYIEALHELPELDKQRLLYGNWNYDNDPARLVDYMRIADMFTNTFVLDPTEQRYMTADIALYGSDRFTVMIWVGWTVVKVFDFPRIIEGDEVEEKIKSYAEEYKVPRSNIVYDSDGLGGFLRGYLKNANPFVNNSKPFETGIETPFKEEYNSLKTQCSFYLAKKIQKNEVYIQECSPEQRECICDELQYMKRNNVDSDKKLSLVPKDKIKEQLGRSPDFSDSLMMRSFFDVSRQKTSEVVGGLSNDELLTEAEDYHGIGYGETDGY